MKRMSTQVGQLDGTVMRKALIIVSVLALLLSGVVTGRGPVAHAADVAEKDGVSVTIYDAPTVKTGERLQWRITVNCNSSRSCDGLRVPLHIVRPDGAEMFRPVAPGNIKLHIENADSADPIVVFDSFPAGNNASVDVGYMAIDNPWVPGDYPLTWDAQLADDRLDFTGGVAKGAVTGDINVGSKYLNKRVSSRHLTRGQRVQYEVTYVRRREVGSTGVLGTIRDQLPAGMKLVEVRNEDYGDDVISGHRLSKKYIQSDENGVSVVIDKALDYETAQNDYFRIYYIAEATQDVELEKDLINTWGFESDGLTDLAGNPLTKSTPGVPQDKTAAVTVHETIGTVVTVTKAGGQTRANGTSDVPWNIHMRTNTPGKFTLHDVPRPAYCAEWSGPRRFDSQECATPANPRVPGADFDSKKSYVSIDKVTFPSVETFVSPTGYHLPAIKVTFFNEAGETDVHEFPAAVTNGTWGKGNIAEAVPRAGFIAARWDAEIDFDAENYPAGGRMAVAQRDTVNYPEGVLPDNEAEPNTWEFWNDLENTFAPASSPENPVEGFASSYNKVYQAFAAPRIIVKPNPNFTNANNRAEMWISNGTTVPFVPVGYVAVPPGMKIDFSQATSRESAACSINPNDVVFTLLDRKSPSGGQLWKFEYPAEKAAERPFVSTGSLNQCYYSIPMTRTYAKAGDYNDPNPAAEFPAVEGLLGSQDLNQGLLSNSNEFDAGSLQADAFGYGCEDPASDDCDKTTRRFASSHRPTMIPRSVGQVLEKWGDGDKDDARTTFDLRNQPAGVANVSNASRDANFYVVMGASGSEPVKNLVAYDLLPSNRNEQGEFHRLTNNPNEHSGHEPGRNVDLVPTLASKIELPEAHVFENGQWTDRPLDVTIWYSESDNPCRPEMDPARGAYPTAECTSFNAKGEWTEDPQDLSKVRAIRFQFNQDATEEYEFKVPMRMPRLTVADNPVDDIDIAVNRVASRGEDSSGRDQGIIGPKYARVQYYPEFKVNKAIVNPETGEVFDGADQVPAFKRGDELTYRITVSGIGDVVTAGPIVRDHLPAGLEFVEFVTKDGEAAIAPDNAAGKDAASADGSVVKDATGDQIVWNVPAVDENGIYQGDNKGKPATLEFKVRISPRAQSGTIANVAFGGTGEHFDTPTAEACAAKADSDKKCDTQAFEILPDVSGHIYDDLNNNGEFWDDYDELYTKPVTVTLLDESGQPVMKDGKPVSVVTEDGTFSFPGVAPGTYKVRFEVPEEVQLSPLVNTDGSIPVGDNRVSDAGATGDTPVRIAESVPFEVTANGMPNVDAGVYAPGNVRVDIEATVTANYFNTYDWSVAKTAAQSRVLYNSGSPALTYNVDVTAGKETSTATGVTLEGVAVNYNDSLRPNRVAVYEVEVVDHPGITCETPDDVYYDIPGKSGDTPGVLKVPFTCSGDELNQLVEGKTSVDEIKAALADLKIHLSNDPTRGEYDEATKAAVVEVAHDEDADVNAAIAVKDVLSIKDGAEVSTVAKLDDATVTYAEVKAAPNSKKSFTYTTNVASAAAGECVSYRNTAELTLPDGAALVDSTLDDNTAAADVEACASEALDDRGEATARFDRIYGWELSKTPGEPVITAGDADTNKNIAVPFNVVTKELPSETASHTYTGVIQVRNPNSADTGFDPMRVQVSAVSQQRNFECTVSDGNLPEGVSVASGEQREFAFTCAVPADYDGELTDTIAYTIKRLDGDIPDVTKEISVNGTIVEFNKTVTVTDADAGVGPFTYTWSAADTVHTEVATMTATAEEGTCVSLTNTATLGLAEGEDAAHESGKAKATAEASKQVCLPTIAVKKFIGDTTDNTVDNGDGQDVERAVLVTPQGENREVPVTFTFTPSASDVTNITFANPNVDYGTVPASENSSSLSQTATFVVTGDGELYNDGQPFEVSLNDQGEYVMPAGLVLKPGQTLTGNAVRSNVGAVSASEIIATATAVVNGEKLTASDPLFIKTAATMRVEKFTGDWSPINGDANNVPANDADSADQAANWSPEGPFTVNVAVVNTSAEGLSPIVLGDTAAEGALTEARCVVAENGAMPANDAFDASNIVWNANAAGGTITEGDAPYVLAANTALVCRGEVEVDVAGIYDADALHADTVDVSATGTQSGSPVTAQDSFNAKVDRQSKPDLQTKIFIADASSQELGEGDGQDSDSAVEIPADVPQTATVTVTNNGTAPVDNVAVVVTNADGEPIDLLGKTFTLNGEVVPGTPAEGAMLRIAADGTVVLSDDSSLTPVALQPGQTATLAEVPLPASPADTTTNYDVAASGVDVVTRDELNATDPLFVHTDAPEALGTTAPQLPEMPIPAPAIEGKLFITSVAEGDGQDEAGAVSVKSRAPFEVTAEIRNSGDSPLNGVSVNVPGDLGVDPSKMEFTVSGDVVKGEPVSGLVLRVDADGKVVLSDDESLAPLLLQPGQTVTGVVTVDALPDDVARSADLEVSGVEPVFGSRVDASDPLFVKSDAPVAVGTSTTVPVEPEPTDEPLGTTVPAETEAEPTDVAIGTTAAPLPTGTIEVEPSPEPHMSSVTPLLGVVGGLAAIIPLVGLVHAGSSAVAPAPAPVPAPVTPAPEIPVKGIPKTDSNVPAPAPAPEPAPARGVLAQTGANTIGLGLFGLLAMVLGAAFLVLRRKNS